MESKILLGSDGNASHSTNIIRRAKMTTMPKANIEKIMGREQFWNPHKANQVLPKVFWAKVTESSTVANRVVLSASGGKSLFSILLFERDLRVGCPLRGVCRTSTTSLLAIDPSVGGGIFNLIDSIVLHNPSFFTLVFSPLCTLFLRLFYSILAFVSLFPYFLSLTLTQN